MIESQEHHKDVSKKAFIKGLISGVLIVGVLGGVYFMGASSSGGWSLGNKNGVVANTNLAPTNPNPNQPTVGTVVPANKDEHIKGSPNADIVLIEYSDLECPYCSRFHPTMQQVLQAYGDKVAWVYRHFPLNSIHPGAQKKAEAAECVTELGGNDKFWKFADLVFAKSAETSASAVLVTDLKGFATQAGVDGDKFQTCLDSGKY